METDERIKQREAEYWAYLKEMFNNPELAIEAHERLSKMIEEAKYPNRWKLKIKKLILAFSSIL